MGLRGPKPGNLGRTTILEPGTRFGRLVIEGDVILKTRKDGRNRAFYAVLCDCGQRREVAASNLRSGNTTSCGCYHLEVVKEKFITHGTTAERKPRPRLYVTWKNMRQRCTNPNTHAYPWYGGKGITVCEEWNDYTVFRDWAMANGYADDLTIERIDPEGNYEPGNCEWITASENVSRARRYDRTSALARCPGCDHTWQNRDHMHCASCHSHLTTLAAWERHRC